MLSRPLQIWLNVLLLLWLWKLATVHLRCLLIKGFRSTFRCTAREMLSKYNGINHTMLYQCAMYKGIFTCSNKTLGMNWGKANRYNYEMKRVKGFLCAEGGEKQNVAWERTTNFPCSMFDDVFRDSKTLNASQPFLLKSEVTLFKKAAVPFLQGRFPPKHQVAALQSSLHGGLKICNSQNRTQRLQPAPVPVHSSTHAHTQTPQTQSTADSTRHFLSTLFPSTQTWLHPSNKLPFKNLHLFKGLTALGAIWMLMNSNRDFVLVCWCLLGCCCL